MSYREELLSHRKHLTEAKLKQHELYDKSLLTLSFGSLVVSVTFANNQFITNQPPDYGFLMWAWGFWLASALLVLFSLISSQYAINGMISKIDKDLENSNDIGKVEKTQVKPNGVDNECRGKKWRNLTEMVNLVAGVLYFVGIVFMLCFANVNMEERTVSERNDKKDAGDLDLDGSASQEFSRGFVPDEPPPPPPGENDNDNSGGQGSDSDDGTSSGE